MARGVAGYAVRPKWASPGPVWGAGLMRSQLVVLVSGWSTGMESVHQPARWTAVLG